MNEKILNLIFDKHCKVKEVAYQENKLVCDDLNKLKEDLILHLCIEENNQKIVDYLNKSLIENHLQKENELLNKIIDLSLYKAVVEKLQIDLELMIRENERLYEQSKKTEWDTNHYDSCIGQIRNIKNLLNKLLKINIEEEMLKKIKC